MNKVVLIIPFYGRLPWYFNFFLKSLDGRAFDVLFVSDLSPENKPENFRQLSMDFKTLNALINSKLGCNLELKNTYKLCDFKPMYGKIFEDYIKGYEYWAFGDCDLVYGTKMDCVLKTLCEDIWDVASLRNKWISGSFCLMRNVSAVNTLYKRVRTLSRMLASDKCVQFDELGGQWFDALLQGAITIEECEKSCDSFTAAVWRSKDIRFFHEDIICEDPILDRYVEMKDGQLFLDGDEIPVFHFINAKHGGYFYGKSIPYDVIGSYRIDNTGFYISSVEWRLRALVSRVRKVRLHFKWYRDMVQQRGIVSLIRHFLSRLVGNK